MDIWKKPEEKKPVKKSQPVRKGREKTELARVDCILYREPVCGTNPSCSGLRKLFCKDGSECAFYKPQ